MKKSFLLITTPLVAMMLLTGCSAGETPRLSDSPVAGSTANPSNEGTRNPSKEATGEATEKSSEGTKETEEPKDVKTSNPDDSGEDVSEKDKEETDKLITSGDELPRDTFSEKNDEPINVPPPVYEVENEVDEESTTTVDAGITAEVTTVFNTYIAALKAEDWESACSVVKYDPEKGLQFCIDTLSSGKWSPNNDFTIENSIGSQNSISGVVIFTKKSESTTDREVVRFIQNPEGQWKIMIPSLVA